MFRVFLAALLFASADAMAGRPKISVARGGAKAAVKSSKTATASPVEYSASIPFAPKPAKLDGTLLGDIGFDPLGLSNLWDIKWLRAAEIKHGRVGMLAATGFLVQEGYRLPGPASNPELFATAKTPLEALSTAPPLGLAQIVALIFLIELVTSSSLLITDSFYEDSPNLKAPAGSGSPGDLGWDPLGLSAGGLNLDYAIAELKHGRLAMLGAAGMLAGSLVSGKSISEQTYDWLGLPFN
ncbi:hypothetical protein KFE25_003291 [Diacronema lutheri]|uniref:Uncharacterized protein n=1 Tax=Diacronema lutheri TaxID=2081491 RepID=A0A8J6CE65_DIALT|nr:hypothetical protein KFE25_003291 [Diacronema lutheri]